MNDIKIKIHHRKGITIENGSFWIMDGKKANVYILSRDPHSSMYSLVSLNDGNIWTFPSMDPKGQFVEGNWEMLEKDSVIEIKVK